MGIEEQADKPARKGGCVLKGILGCGCLMFVGFIALAASAVWLSVLGFQHLDDYSEPFAEKGYRVRRGQMINERQTVEQPTVYTAQIVRIKDGSDGNLAFMCQVVEIQGTVEGDIDFMGQALTIKPDAIVTGDIRVKAGQVVRLDGRVDGEIEGSMQELIDNRPKIDAAVEKLREQLDDGGLRIELEAEESPRIELEAEEK